MIDRRQVLAATTFAALAAQSARAQSTIINKAAKITVGFAAGGSADIVARLIANQMKTYAPSLVIDNRPGAGGRTGLQGVMSHEPDGSSLVLTPASMMVLYPHVYKALTYQPLTDFAAVTSVCAAPFALAVGPMVPADVKTVSDFLSWCGTNPSKANYGTSGAGSMPHFAGVNLGRISSKALTHVAYRGGALAMQDLISGTIPAVMLVLANALSQAQAGQVRILAITSSARTPLLPTVPTMREAGFPDMEALEWFGVFAPKGTPEPLLNSASRAIRAALEATEVRTRLEQLAFLIEPVDTPSSFAARVARDIEKWQPVVKASGYTAAD